MARFNLEGWKFAELLKGNKKSLLDLAKWVVPYLVSAAISAQPEFQFVITVVGKGVLDIIHYYLNE